MDLNAAADNELDEAVRKTGGKRLCRSNFGEAMRRSRNSRTLNNCCEKDALFGYGPKSA